MHISGICQCLQDGCWVNEEPYEVQGVSIGDSTIVSEAPRKGRQNKAQQVQWLTLAFEQVHINLL